MTLDNVKKQYKYFSKLAKGEFNERDFDSTSGSNEDGNEEGITLQGTMSRQRVDLIKSNAQRHKLDIERKFPEFKEVEPPKVEEVKKESKSKEKK